MQWSGCKHAGSGVLCIHTSLLRGICRYTQLSLHAELGVQTLVQPLHNITAACEGAKLSYDLPRHHCRHCTRQKVLCIIHCIC